MTASHKEALALGRQQGNAVRRYLDALEAHKPKRGRKRTEDSIAKQLSAIDAKLAAATNFDRLALLQQKADLESELGNRQAAVDLSDLEAAFVSAAADYGARKGISYATWRAVGVDASVLAKAGIKRGD